MSVSVTPTPDPTPPPAEKRAATNPGRRSTGKGGSRTGGGLGGRRRTLWQRLKRLLTRQRPQAPRTGQTMLPVLIQVFAGFTKLDG
ncbi:MAG: hypothetical protein KDM91_22480, partial [Verrucomicrobiae bacterium]|nr:hypothetical protein [Verrucomicrobiae bacterium]